MPKQQRIAKVEGPEDWEMGLLFELRILKAADAMAPVLEAIAAGIAALYIEGERRLFVAREEARKKQRERLARPVERGEHRVGYIPLLFRPNHMYLRKLIAERTASGKWLSRLDRELRAEIMQVMYGEIAEKARQAGINSCRAYVGATQ